ncbi:capsule biosynthesis GfcC D2 domain-containing protein, partial [Escherichia sp. R-CC3]
MIKQTIVALILSVGASSVFAAGTVKVFSNGSSEAKTLTGAEYLIDLVGQPRLANS